MQSQIGLTCPTLIHLVKQCLQNVPNQRPSTEDLLSRLQGVKGEVGGEYGNGLMKMDVMMRLKLAKEVKWRDRRIEELTQQQVRMTKVLSLCIQYTLINLMKVCVVNISKHQR